MYTHCTPIQNTDAQEKRPGSGQVSDYQPGKSTGINPLSPKIWLLILPLVLDQDNNFHPISLNILITFVQDNVWIL